MPGNKKNKRLAAKAKKNQRKPNLRTEYRNDARKFMLEVLKGNELMKTNIDTYKTYADAGMAPKDKLPELDELRLKAGQIVIEADKLATEVRESTLKDMKLSEWKETEMLVCMPKSVALENYVNGLANLVESSLLIISEVVGLEGYTDAQLGMNSVEIKTEQELEELDAMEGGVYAPTPEEAPEPDEELSTAALEEKLAEDMAELSAEEQERGITIVS